MPKPPVAREPNTGPTAPASVLLETWLRELGLEPVAHGEREGVQSWDVVMHGRRRRDIRGTVIVQPGVACLVWVHYAPPLGDSFRKSYRQLLHWNDEYPFAKFALSADERLVLTTELPADALDLDALGTALARLVAICDLLLDESRAWIWPLGHAPAAPPEARPSRFLARYEAQLGELMGVTA